MSLVYISDLTQTDKRNNFVLSIVVKEFILCFVTKSVVGFYLREMLFNWKKKKTFLTFPKLAALTGAKLFFSQKSK